MGVIAYGAKHSFSALRPMTIERRALRPEDVEIAIEYCGVCHSDVHQAKNEWKDTIYPCVPGHEIVGRVRAFGGGVTRWQLGARVGVGPMVDSCRRCEACLAGLEPYCEEGAIGTYNGNMRHPSEANLTFGGYSESIVVTDDFVLEIPELLEPAAAAPLLCAGVTVWSPMQHWGVGRGTKLGVVGIGGLGHLAVRLGRALGAEVTAITSKEEKRSQAYVCGASHVIVSGDKEAMKAAERSLDFIISTIPAAHDPNPYVALLGRDGMLAIVGCLMPLSRPLDMSGLFIDRKSVVSSCCGGLRETQELLDFCAAQGIRSDVERVVIDDINDVFKRLHDGEVPHRFVIDMATLAGKTEDQSLAAKLGL